VKEGFVCAGKKVAFQRGRKKGFIWPEKAAAGKRRLLAGKRGEKTGCGERRGRYWKGVFGLGEGRRVVEDVTLATESGEKDAEVLLGKRVSQKISERGKDLQPPLRKGKPTERESFEKRNGAPRAGGGTTVSVGERGRGGDPSEKDSQKEEAPSHFAEPRRGVGGEKSVAERGKSLSIKKKKRGRRRRRKEKKRIGKTDFQIVNHLGKEKKNKRRVHKKDLGSGGGN